MPLNFSSTCSLLYPAIEKSLYIRSGLWFLIAPGIDRIVMLLANEKNIREVTMFPMNQNAQELMMNAPSEVSENQLKELNLTIKKRN